MRFYEKLGGYKPYGNASKESFDHLGDYLIRFLKQYFFASTPQGVNSKIKVSLILVNDELPKILTRNCHKLELPSINLPHQKNLKLMC